MQRRRESIAALIADLALTQPRDFAATVNALVEAAGELPDDQWRQRWDHPPAAATGRVGRAMVIPPGEQAR